jgi:hypothetical protein
MTRFLAVLSGLLLTLAVTIELPWAGLAALVLVVAGWRYGFVRSVRCWSRWAY